MKPIFLFTLSLLASQVALQSINAQTVTQAESLFAAVAAVKAADDARIATMRSPDRDKLTAIFSDDLRYAHSNGVVDTKGSFIELLGSGKTKYLGYEHKDRSITIPAPGIALVVGQARIQAESAAGKMDNVLSYLAVWREEKGQWRFLAWQSCKLPVTANP